MKKSFLVFALLFIISACAPASPSSEVTIPKVISSAPSTPQPTVVASTQELTPEPTSTKPPLYFFLTEQEIIEKVQSADGLVARDGFHSIYIHEVGMPRNIGAYYKEKELLNGASTINIAIATVVLRVMEKEGIEPDRMILENSNLTISDLVHDMLVNHDGSAKVFLLNYVNHTLKYNFDDELAELGLPDFNVNMGLVTAESMGKLVERIVTDDLGLKNNQYLYNLMNEQHTPVDCASDMTWAISCSHPNIYLKKIGFIYNFPQSIPNDLTINFVTSDVGLWISPEGHKFVYVLMANYGPEKDFRMNNDFTNSVFEVLTSRVP